MTHLLPPNLLKLFAPRPPLPYLRAVGKDPNKPKQKNVNGVSSLLAQIKEQTIVDTAKDDEREEGEEEQFTYAEEVKRSIRREERKKAREENLTKAKESYKPTEDPNAQGDPYKTLFISRLSKKVSEKDLQKEFERYGDIERIRLVRDPKGKSRGYAFIVYERERDMKGAH
ncbi:hypothetical protein CALVIDRAFT_481195 [Calocera viscosa TUFC12733]|uniref:RRM domain-containing protein n=1 Tax=Calocera viscosa (strain TUFC12733) TaxID=1330018 RepID=A0A167MI42_CALVF|nr:hypothetical protein CALVIDRAFT_481195 [Calocera viscosa TUFC12733]